MVATMLRNFPLMTISGRFYRIQHRVKSHKDHIYDNNGHPAEKGSLEQPHVCWVCIWILTETIAWISFRILDFTFTHQD